MEDSFFDFIWIAILAASIITSVVKSHRKPNRKHDTGQHPTTGPLFNIPEEIHPDSQETIAEEFSGVCERFEPERMTSAAQPAPEREQQPFKNGQERTGQEETEPFDLRRAVIYSEILKPKFDEHDSQL